MSIIIQKGYKKSFETWLLLCVILTCFLIFFGGVVRLTKSGLSITEWKPITGAIPPLSEKTWNEEFNKYKEIPEYIYLRQGMQISEFKKIYVLEYTHRLIARADALLFVLPFLFMIIRKTLPTGTVLPLSIGAILLLVQGYAGWKMVESGLSVRTDVEPIMLTLHLLLAISFLAILLWTVWKEKEKKVFYEHYPYSTNSKRLCSLLLSAIIIQTAFGAINAGSKAGLLFPTFPLMNGKIIPDDILFIKPKFINFIYNPTTVHFMHRLMAFIILIGSALSSIFLRREDERSYHVSVMLFFIVICQISIGAIVVMTKLSKLAAISHQIFGIIIFMVGLRLRFLIGKRTLDHKINHFF